MQKRFIYFILAFFFIIQVQAIRYATFSYVDKETNQPVENVKIKGYACQSSQCTSMIGELWNGNFRLTNATAPLDKETLDFPTTMQGAGYILISMHPAYKTYARFPVVLSGTSSTDPLTAPIDKLEKVSACSSPVSLSIVNNNRVNLPVSVTSGANLSAETASAIGSNHFGYYPPELNYYYEVETTLHLKIFRYNATTSKNIGSAIHSEDVVKRIYYDDTVNVAFTDWMPPAQTADFLYYNVTVESDVTDPKCSSKVNQRASKIVRVWKNDPRNECYSLIDSSGIGFTPVDFFNKKPEVGQEVTITFKKLSNYANDFEPWDPLFKLTPQDTNINLRLTGAESTLITRVLPKNNDDNFKSVSVKWTPVKSGSYTLELTADAATCPVIKDTSSDPYIQTIMVFDPPKYDMKFTVKAAGSPVTNAKIILINPASEKYTSTLGTATFKNDIMKTEQRQ